MYIVVKVSVVYTRLNNKTLTSTKEWLNNATAPFSTVKLIYRGRIKEMKLKINLD